MQKRYAKQMNSVLSQYILWYYSASHDGMNSDELYFLAIPMTLIKLTFLSLICGWKLVGLKTRTYEHVCIWIHIQIYVHTYRTYRMMREMIDRTCSVHCSRTVTYINRRKLHGFESLSIKMDEFLIILLEKYLERGVERITAKEHLYSKGMILVENIKLFRRLIKNNFKRYLGEELSEKSVIYDLARDIDRLVLKVKEWELAVQKERLHFCQFQRNVEIRWKATNAMKIKIEENLREKLAVYTKKYPPRILIGGLENEMRKKSVEMKTKSIEEHLKYTTDARCSRQTDLCRTRVKARKRCLEQIERYDSNIEALYSGKNTLLIDKNSVEKQYFIVQDQLIGQRGLYNRLKEERELNAKQAFLMKLESFRRNRAAKIIQRNWKYCTVRASWKKGKGRK